MKKESTMMSEITEKESLCKQYGCPAGTTWHDVVTAGLNSIRIRTDEEIQAFINNILD